MSGDKELQVTGIEIASLIAVLVIVLVIIYVSATGVSKLFNQPAVAQEAVAVAQGVDGS